MSADSQAPAGTLPADPHAPPSPASGGGLSEEWRPLPGWPYRVSSLGRVINLAGRTLKLTDDGRGRLAFTVRAETRKATYKIYRAVMLSFVGPRPDGMQVAHLNGDLSDNRLTNLAYVTQGENERHKVQHGTVLRGEKHHQAKLTTEQVREIRASNEYASALCKRYGVAETTIYRVQKRVRWNHVD